MSGKDQVPGSPLLSTAAWIGLALLGIALAAGISIAASHLSSQRIGLSSEPISAGRELAPQVRPANPAGGGHHRHRHRHEGGSTTTPSTPSTTPSPAPAPPVTTVPSAPQPAPIGDDSGGDSHGGSGGHGGDD